MASSQSQLSNYQKRVLADGTVEYIVPSKKRAVKYGEDTKLTDEISSKEEYKTKKTKRHRKPKPKRVRKAKKKCGGKRRKTLHR